MRALLHQDTQASGGTQTLAPGQKLQALAQKLEPSYQTIHTFWMQNKNNYHKKGIPLLLIQMNKVHNDMTRLMHSLRQGRIPSDMTIQQMQEDVNKISFMQTNAQFGYQDISFSNYMVAIRDLTSILSDTKR